MEKVMLFSFFSGCGLLDLGFEMAGFDVSFVNEFNPSFMKAYKYAREKMGISSPLYGYHNADINQLLGAEESTIAQFMEKSRRNGSLIGFIGGPPCPDFSVAGKNKGRDGKNGQLSYSYVSLIIQMKPDFFLFENVKGLYRTARHREYFEELKHMLQDAGYCLTERLVNSLEYGVPQERERIILFGMDAGYGRGRWENGTIPDFPWTKHCIYDMDTIKEVAWPVSESFAENSAKPCPHGIIDSLTVEYWFRKNDVYNHPNSGDYFVPRQGISKIQSVDEGDTGKKSYKRLHRWRYSPTAAYGNNEVHLHPYKTRRLSVAETLAIQSLPKEFCLPPELSLTDKFKTVGNGVPFLLSLGLAYSIRDFIHENCAVRISKMKSNIG